MSARVLAVCLLLLGCRERPAEREVVVFAAASLREAFTELGADFQRAHPGVTVSFEFAGSQALRTQLEHGARADVFASADTVHLDALATAGLVGARQVFARNELVLVVSKERAASLNDFASLPSAARIVVGAPEVPVGRYTEQVLERAGPDFAAQVRKHIVSRELNVRQVLTRVSLNEAEAGLVYRSDAQLAGDKVAVVPIPPAFNVVAEYPVAVVSRAPHPGLAADFVALLRSPEGTRVLVAHGFLPPAPEAP